jgi:ABC-type nitrate/sulfonate/bicarbonate transport system ATPase subunit
MTAMGKEKPMLLLMLGGSGAGKGTFLRAGAFVYKDQHSKTVQVRRKQKHKRKTFQIMS